MKKLFGKFQNQMGFIAIETVIVAGLMVALGAVALGSFSQNGKDVIFASADRVAQVLDISVDMTPII